MKTSTIRTLLGLALLLAGCSDATISTNNSPPGALISAPGDGSEALVGEDVDFSGSVQDATTIAADLQLAWTSSLDGSLLDGAPDSDGTTSFTTSELSVGLHTITLQVQDAEGATGEDTVELTVRADSAPTISIAAPSDDEVYSSDVPLSLEATVADAEDAADALAVVWTDATGVVDEAAVVDSAGNALASVDLAPGTWSLTATVTDSAGNTATASVEVSVEAPNVGPSCSLLAPVDATVGGEGAPVELAGLVLDPDDEPSALTAIWSSDVDGELASGAPASDGATGLTISTLSVGPHALTLEGSDPDGATCAESISIAISAAPVATILAPTGSDPIDAGVPTTLQGTVSDAEDADSSLAVAWSSSVDGALASSTPDASGAVTEQVALSGGSHVITLEATDSIGQTGSATITVLVNEVPGSPTVTLDPADPATTDPLVVVFEVTATDPDGQPAPLTYDYTWSRDNVPQPAHDGLDTLPASATTRGETWSVEVTAFDGQASGPPGGATATVENSAPETAPPTLTGAPLLEGGIATCGDALTADADSDPVTVTWSWLGSPSRPPTPASTVPGSTRARRCSAPPPPATATWTGRPCSPRRR